MKRALHESRQDKQFGPCSWISPLTPKIVRAQSEPCIYAGWRACGVLVNLKNDIRLIYEGFVHVLHVKLGKFKLQFIFLGSKFETGWTCEHTQCQALEVQLQQRFSRSRFESWQQTWHRLYVTFHTSASNPKRQSKAQSGDWVLADGNVHTCDLMDVASTFLQ